MLRLMLVQTCAVLLRCSRALVCVAVCDCTITSNWCSRKYYFYRIYVNDTLRLLRSYILMEQLRLLMLVVELICVRLELEMCVVVSNIFNSVLLSMRSINIQGIMVSPCLPLAKSVKSSSDLLVFTVACIKSNDSC